MHKKLDSQRHSYSFSILLLFTLHSHGHIFLLFLSKKSSMLLAQKHRSLPHDVINQEVYIIPSIFYLIQLFFPSNHVFSISLADGTITVHQGLCHQTDSPSERPASSSRRPPEPENVPLSLRPTGPSLQRQQETESKSKVLILASKPQINQFQIQLPSTVSQFVAELTSLMRVKCSVGSTSSIWHVRWFNHVTCVRIQQDSEQVLIPCPLHHFLHLGKTRVKTLISYLSAFPKCLNCTH